MNGGLSQQMLLHSNIMMVRFPPAYYWYHSFKLPSLLLKLFTRKAVSIISWFMPLLITTPSTAVKSSPEFTFDLALLNFDMMKLNLPIYMMTLFYDHFWNWVLMRQSNMLVESLCSDLCSTLFFLNKKIIFHFLGSSHICNIYGIISHHKMSWRKQSLLIKSQLLLSEYFYGVSMINSWTCFF